MKRACLYALLLVAAPYLCAQRKVIQVPADTSTIQAAIDIARDGDTVLVAEGLYYENIRIQSKAIVVASWFILDGDTSHISRTIINGSRPVDTDNAAVVKIAGCRDTNTVLCGFTITGGYGQRVFIDGEYGRVTGGVGVNGSSALIAHNRIIRNIINRLIVPDAYVWATAAGIGANTLGVDSTFLIIRRNLVAENGGEGEFNSAGGIFYLSDTPPAVTANLIIENNTIKDNLNRDLGTWKGMGGGLGISVLFPRGGLRIVRNNLIVGNQVRGYRSFGGGAYIVYTDSPEGTVDDNVGEVFLNNVFDGNYAEYRGGAVSVWRYSSATTNLNSWGYYRPRPVFINNTFVNNAAADGSAFFIMNHVPFLMNNILWDQPQGAGKWGEVFLGDVPEWTQWHQPNTYGGIRLFHSDVRGGYGVGQGNIDADPLFQDSTYRLSSLSPCAGGGIDSMEVAGVWYRAPRRCLHGSMRPDPFDGKPDMGACESPARGAPFAYDARVIRMGLDTLAFSTRIEYPPALPRSVVAVLSEQSGTSIDSVVLADDGIHGDGPAGDGVWGSFFSPPSDDTIHIALRTSDPSGGATRTLPDAALYMFTRHAVITVDTRSLALGLINRFVQSIDTSFVVRNTGYAADSLTAAVDPGNVVPDTAVSVFPGQFVLLPGESLRVTLRIRPALVAAAYYAVDAIVESHSGFGQTMFRKHYTFQVVTRVADLTEVPTEFALKQNYPNPFNPSTVIAYDLPAASPVKLAVYDLLGREVAVLVDERKDPGRYELRWDASGHPSGVYFYRITAGMYGATRRMLVMR